MEIRITATKEKCQTCGTYIFSRINFYGDDGENLIEMIAGKIDSIIATHKICKVFSFKLKDIRHIDRYYRWLPNTTVTRLEKKFYVEIDNNVVYVTKRPKNDNRFSLFSELY